MKLVLNIFLIFILNILSFSLKAQDPAYPTATITSQNISFCEVGDVDITIEFTGTGPFSFMYSINGGVSLWSGSSSETTYTFSIQLSESAEITIPRVYDNNYQLNPSDPMGSGVENLSNIMMVQIDEKPSPNAGLDDEICGYEYTLKGTITDANHSIYWNDMTGVGTYLDINSPTTTFTADAEGIVSFILTEKNGACIVTDEVNINFKGSPTAKLISAGEYKFCSTDAIADNVSVDIEFTGNAPFDYVMKNSTNSFNESSSGLTDNIQYPVASSDQYYIYSVSDGNGCAAPADDITGTQIATDLKPNTNAGEDQIVCGKDFTLEAIPTSTANGEWSSASGGINFVNISDGNTVVTSVNYQLAALTWTETDIEMSCVSSDDVQIRFAEPPSLQLLKTDDQICNGESSYLTVNITNGNEPFTLLYNDNNQYYSELNLTLGNSSPLELKPTFDITSSIQSQTDYHFTSIEGVYGCKTSYDDLVYSVYVDEKPVPNAGIDQLNSCDRVIQLNAEPSVGIGNWSLDSNGEFSDVNDPNSTFTAYDSKEYNLVWNELNGQCSTSDDVTISIQPSPYPVNAGIDSTIYALDNIQLYAQTLTEGIGTWSLIEGDATIEDLNLSTTVVTGMKPGVYRFVWSAETTEGGCPPVEDEVVITMEELFQTGGFSPNGDNLNEYFKIPGSKNLNNVHFVVFDKFGKLKYEEKAIGGDHEIKWNGKSKDGEDLPEGVYYYVFDADELSKPVKKYLVIKR